MLKTALLSLVMGCTDGTEGKSVGPVDCCGGDTDAECIEFDCRPKIIIPNRAACDGFNTGGSEGACLGIDGQMHITTPNNDFLEMFTCVEGDPCALAHSNPDQAYCWLVIDEEYHPPATAEGGPTPEVACDEAWDNAGNDIVFQDDTVSEIRNEITDIAATTCGTAFFTIIESTCESAEDSDSDVDTDAVGEAEFSDDTGLSNLSQQGIVETYDPGYIFYVDPLESSISIRSANETWDSSSLEGFLLGIGSPARYLFGAVFGGRITVDGSEYRKTWAMFDSDLYLIAEAGDLIIPEDQLNKISWQGVRVSDSEFLAYEISPNDGADGGYDLGMGTWYLSFSQNLAGGRRVEVDLAGSIIEP